MAPRVAAREAAGAAYDLIIVGAGINGAGIARDAALRGLRVLLLDKGDIGGGTTSWSTRLIHGGLRYLEHREIGLVRESLRERERLLRLAPHLVKPLPLLIPIYRGDRRGRGLIRVGMVAYDLLSFDKSLDRHRMLGRAEAMARAPGLAPDGLRGAAVYYDAQVEYAERLAVENVLAARGRGATVLTHARVERLVVEDGAVAGVAFVDLLGGDEELTTRAPAVINVAGPWVDRVLVGTGAPAPRLIGGTKGAHIVVGPFPGAPADALYVEAKRDGRPYFVVPWNGQFLIGTTDSRFEGDVDRVEVSDDEVDYLLAETNRVLPGAELGRSDVHYAYAGIRPLPYRADGVEGAITRRHLIHDHAAAGLPGLFSIVGGKLTTFRGLAEQTVDAVYRRLGRPVTPSTTASVPLPGAVVPAGGLDGVRAVLAAVGALSPATVDHLLRVYGGRAVEVMDLAAADPDLIESFDPDSGAIGAEVVFAFRAEGAETLADALLRRTMVGLGPEVGIGADEAAAAIACRHLGWDDARAAAEVEAYRAFVARYRPRALASVAAARRR